MGVPSKCTIVRTMRRSAYAPEVLGRKNRTQNHTQVGVARNRVAGTVINVENNYILCP
jgi:hypothetical protein